MACRVVTKKLKVEKLTPRICKKVLFWEKDATISFRIIERLRINNYIFHKLGHFSLRLSSILSNHGDLPKETAKFLAISGTCQTFDGGLEGQ